MRTTAFVSIGIAFYAVSAAPLPRPHAAPMVIMANQGEADAGVRFLAKGPRLAAYFSARHARIQAGGASLQVEFLGATPEPRLEATGQDSGVANFLVGPENDWRFGVPLLRGVAYRDLYPGVDLIY